MQVLSLLFGSMSVACLCAGLLLLLQPAPAQAAGLFGNCTNCSCTCATNNGTSGPTCTSLGCSLCTPVPTPCPAACGTCATGLGNQCWCTWNPPFCNDCS